MSGHSTMKLEWKERGRNKTDSSLFISPAASELLPERVILKIGLSIQDFKLEYLFYNFPSITPYIFCSIIFFTPLRELSVKNQQK